jgi:neutral trehalase
VTVDWIRPYEGSQPPVVAWGAWKVYERTKDIEFLRAIYRPFARNTDWWMEARDEDGDGLLEWFERLESGWDNSPRWDPEFGKLETCDLNSYVLMQMKIMAKMADELGRPDEARDWRSKADALGKRMVEKLYFPEENIFRDIRYDTHEPADILTPASFLPLWAGAPLDREKAKAMIRDYLLNPRYFYGEIPFPTVAYCDPKYDSAAFWRGPTWMNISYLLLEMLVERGFVKEAEKTAKALLDIGARNRYIYEYYDSQTGEGLGVPEYSWTAALFMEMLLGRYKNC